MKYCLNNRVSANLLKSCAEVKFPFGDRRAIPSFAEKYPNADFILEIPVDTDINWAEINDYNTVTGGRVICCLRDLQMRSQCQAYNIRYYWGYAVNSFYELQALKEAGVCYVRLGPPLFFQLPDVRSLGIAVRAVPNVAHMGYFTRKDGIVGQWVRPEDVDLYDPYISVFEFEDCDIAKEEALFRIYGLQQGWGGNLRTLITNLDVDVSTNLIPKEVIKVRLSCGQRCQAGRNCALCHKAFNIAKPGRLQEYMDKRNEVHADTNQE